MEYLVLVGRDLKEVLSRSLGDTAPFFWSFVAPVVLAVLWVGAFYGLWESWFRRGDPGEDGGHLGFKLFFSVFLLSIILCSGASLEYLFLGDPWVHSRILSGILNAIRPG